MIAMRGAENALRLAPALALFPGHKLGDEADIFGNHEVSRSSQSGRVRGMLTR